MKNKNDKRLIGAIEHIDDKFIESAAKKIKAREDGISALGANKAKIIKQVALLAACLVLLGAAVPLAGRLVGLIPELFNPAGTANESNILETNENDPPEVDDLPEEYFTDGVGILSYPSHVLGVEYDGGWIHTSAAYKNLTGAKMEFFEYLYKYDPVAKTSTSICIEPTCKHMDESCPAFVPVGWTVRSLTVFDDWCLFMYTKGVDLDSNNAVNDTKVRIYNMKTGELRVIAETVELENSLTYPVAVFTLDGKVYLNFAKLSVPDMADVLGFTRYYVSCYDPQTDAKEFMCNVPGDVKMVGITNKRIFYAATNSENDAHTDIWTSDYCGTYAYSVGDDFTLQIYDLATDSVSVLNCENIQNLYLDAGEIGFTTTSRIEEYHEYRKDPDAYIAKQYPNVTDPEKISKLKSETEIKLNCKVDMQLYLTDARGENKTLVFEGENIYFNPYRRVGDHIIGTVRIASKYEVRILDSGFAALNLKTGEIEMIPAVKFD